MKKDCHIHAMVFDDSIDSEAYIHQAIAAGIGEICITDHMPLDFQPTNRERIPSARIAEYCAEVRKLARRYEGQIRIRTGIECDYLPQMEETIRKVLAAGAFEYVIGSSHLHVWKEHFVQYPTRSAYANAMLKNTKAAAESGLFDTIAHIDMYRWVFRHPERFPLKEDDFSDCQNQAEETLKTILQNGVNLEINPHFAHQTGRMEDVYPAKPLMEKALQMGISFVFGSDAHRAAHVGCMLPELEQHPLYGAAIRRFEEEEA